LKASPNPLTGELWDFETGQGKAGAFFDMDNTLLSASSGRLYLKWLRQTGQLPLRRWAYISGQVALYITGIVRFPAMMSRVMVYGAGADEAEAWRMSVDWFDNMLRYYIAEGGRKQIDWHKNQGHTVVIVSASTPYAVKPVADALGLEHAFLATELEVVDGRFTGRVVEPACYGDGKVARTIAYARAHGIDLGRSYFYSDSASDLPLLEAVGHPVAVNPNRKLASIAKSRNWPVMKFY